MDADDVLSSLESLRIPKNHASVGLSNLIASDNEIKSLFIHRRLPDAGWSDTKISRLLLDLSTLDTNHDAPVSTTLAQQNGGGSNKHSGRWVGVGEREGRVYSTLVSARHCGLSHGVGRSGDITEAQPKAAGSSAMARLALHLVLDAARRGAGMEGKNGGPASHGILLPLCTGMSMALVLSTLRDAAAEPMGQDGEAARMQRDVVLWSRIDQKSCYKAILSAGLRCVVVPTTIDESTDEVVTDLAALEAALNEHDGRVLAVVTTTSCFAPRIPDRVDEVAKLCASKDGVSHVVNHAYGLQCRRTNKLLNRACAVGRVDAVVCSTDKNFLVPVGGAVVLSPKEGVIRNVGKIYPGRASSAPIFDLFVTLLSMGLDGYTRILSERIRLVEQFEQKLGDVAAKHGERILRCPRNTISFGITLDSLAQEPQPTEGPDAEGEKKKKSGMDVTYFGSMLFTRCVSGTRVVPRGQSKTIAGHEFVGFGSSTEHFQHPYLTAACAVGLTEGEMNEFFARLDKALKDFFAKRRKEDARRLNAQNKE